MAWLFTIKQGIYTRRAAKPKNNYDGYSTLSQLRRFRTYIKPLLYYGDRHSIAGIIYSLAA